MSLARSLAAFVLAAGFAGGVAAQGPHPATDAEIVEQLEYAIAREPALAGTEIKVESRDGVVTLSGFARTMEDIAAAGHLARAIRGVGAVNNDIRIAIRPSRA